MTFTKTKYKLMVAVCLIAMPVGFASCNGRASQGIDSSAKVSGSSSSYEIQANGQYVDENKLLHLPGKDGIVTGDGALKAFSNEKELQDFFDANWDRSFSGVFADTHSMEQISSEKTKLTKPAGILARENDLLVVDGENGCINVLDFDGEFIKTVGTIGNGDLEFLSPTAICEHNGDIYVIDGENDRIQILNPDLSFKSKLRIIRPTSNPNGNFTDIAVDAKDNIYLSRMDASARFMYCYPAGDTTHLPVAIGQNCNGYLAEENGQVYAINYGSTSEEYAMIDGKKSEQPTVQVSGPGENFLFKAYPDRLEKLCTLPVGTCSLDFLMENDELTLIGQRLDKYDINGEYKCTIGKFDTTLMRKMKAYLTKDKYGNYYMTTGNSADIFKFKLNK